MLKSLIVVFLFFVSNLALAKEFPVQARLFLGMTSTSPDNVNNVIEPEGLKKVTGNNQFGVEATYPLHKYFDFGFRYTKHLIANDEDPSSDSTDYNINVSQDSVLFIGRVPLVQSGIFKADVFAGFGGSNTTMKIKTAAQDGELSRSAGDGWFATPYTAAGVSLAVGYKQIYFVMEGGIETNKVTGLKRTGTVNSGIDSLDLSGSYFTIGLMFDGVTATSK